MPVAHRLDAPQPGVTSDPPVDSIAPPVEAALFAALAEAVGIDDCDALLIHLARSYREFTRAEFVILAAQSAPDGRYRVVITAAQTQPALTDYTLPEGRDLLRGLRDDVLRGALESAVVGSSAAMTARTIVAGDERGPVGGLLAGGAWQLPEDADRRFFQATAALWTRALDGHRRLQAAKLESLAQFAAGAGHEINNPLAAISGRAQLLLRDETDPERRRHLLTIGAQALRIRDMIGDTMLFARPPAPEARLLNLSVVLDSVLEKFADNFQSRGLECKREYDADVPIRADETQLCVVISELLRNAIDASPKGGTVRVAAAPANVNGRPWAKLRVQDEGPGLSEEAAKHLFDPFFSGREAGRGLGFGLSKCWRIVTNHGGRIDVDGEQDDGFAMVVRWPASDNESEVECGP